MTARVLVRQQPWSASRTWEVLCPCCAARRPGVAVLHITESWHSALGFASAHGRSHR
jgi:hypothetical protein